MISKNITYQTTKLQKKTKTGSEMKTKTKTKCGGMSHYLWSLPAGGIVREGDGVI